MSANLNDVTRIDCTRDSIMHHLKPEEVSKFKDSTSTVFTERDAGRYSNMFRYVISYRRWLINLVNDGCVLTIVSRNLDRLPHWNTSPLDDTDRQTMSASPSSPLLVVHAMLVVAEDSTIMACTQAFMPKELFRNTCGVNVLTTEQVDEKIEPRTRHMIMKFNDRMIKISMTVESRSTDMPMFINSAGYKDTIRYSLKEG